MTIRQLVDWITVQSVWWLLALLPVFWLIRAMRNKTIAILWRRNLKRDIQHVEREKEACLRMGKFNQAAWYEWQRTELHDLLDRLLTGWIVTADDLEVYNRRRQALVDADYLAKDEARISAVAATMAENAAMPDSNEDSDLHDKDESR
jgi:hypothetical protein